MKKKVVALAGLGALAVVGGTWAYFSQTSEMINPMGTGKYETGTVENFTPGDDWQPGVEVNKDVFAKNTGDLPVLVRVKLDERWTYKADDKNTPDIDESKTPYKELSSLKNHNEFNDLTENGVGGWIAVQPDSDDGKDGDTDGLTTKDHSVVYKELVNITEDLEVDDSWYYNAEDGYWYYTTVLTEGLSTKPFMDSIALATNVDEGRYIKKYYYNDQYTKEELTRLNAFEEKDGKEVIKNDFDLEKAVKDVDGKDVVWTFEGTDADKSIEDLIEAGDTAAKKGKYFFRKSEHVLSDDKGYADSHYELVITTDFVQTTKDAVKAKWDQDGKLSKNTELMNKLNGMIDAVQMPTGDQADDSTDPTSAPEETPSEN